MKFVAIVIFALAFGTVLCDYDLVIRDGPCRELPAVKPFDAARYVGVWYEQMRYEDTYQLNGDCVTATYELKDDGGIKVTNALYWLSNQTSNQAVGEAVLSYPDAVPLAGQFSVRFSPRQPFFNNYNILYTDYENLSIVWNCKPMPGNKHKENFWVLSRNRKLRNQTDFVRKFIADVELETDSIRKTNQENCGEM